MNNAAAFEIDDDFDPLEDLRIDGEEEEPETDYLPPIPDAELSRVPEPVALSAEERIEKLIAGIPGQKFRMLHAVEFCSEPQTFSAIEASVVERFPDSVSVYGIAQLVGLLEEAGALACEVQERAAETSSDAAAGAPMAGDDSLAASGGADQAREFGAAVSQENGYIAVTPPPSRLYTATAEGLAAVERYCGQQVVFAAIQEEERYLPIYRTILEMTSPEEGCGTKELDAVVNVDPLCAEPRRFCGYFLDRLEEAGAVQWKDAWIATDLGREVLASRLFEN